jgi:protein-tyrosine-phosphatase
MTQKPPTVLFACVHNAGRSQMAAAFAERLGGGRVRVCSGGSQPAARVHPAVVQAMAEVGIDLSRATPAPIADEDVAAADVVVTMGCGDACPVYPGKRYLDWPVDDPAGRPLAEVRHIRDDIRRRVVALLDELGVPVSAESDEGSA